MELADLVHRLRVVEVAGKTRPTAIRALAEAMDLREAGIALDVLLEAIEEREAAAHTMVSAGLAMPHALIHWDGDYRVVLGRSRAGVAYDIPGSGRVHLMAMFVVGRRARKELHLEMLAALAELLESEEFRQQIIEARDVRAIDRLLLTRVGLRPEGRPRRLAGVPRRNTILVRLAMDLVEAVGAQALLAAVDRAEDLPWEPLSRWAGRLLVVSAKGADHLPVQRPDTHLFDVPHETLTRMGRAKLGLLLAASAGVLSDEGEVVSVTGRGGRVLDSVSVTRPEGYLRAMFGNEPVRRAPSMRPAVILRVLSLAVELAAEGREGKPAGAIFVIGDSNQVMRHARQLVLNPFHGFSGSLRNLMDPSLGETIKEFAQLDGAFVVQADGTVRSAGTYLIPKSSSARVPAGLGARHQAAAAITAHTRAMAVTVSESTGTVTVFRGGQILFALEQATSMQA